MKWNGTVVNIEIFLAFKRFIRNFQVTIIHKLTIENLLVNYKY